MTTPIETTTLRPLKPTDLLWRGLYGISHGGMDYVVEVDFFDIGEKVRLYRDGALVAEAKLAILCASLVAGVAGFAVLLRQAAKEPAGAAPPADETARNIEGLS